MVIYLSLFKGITLLFKHASFKCVFPKATCLTSKSYCSSGKPLFQCLLYELQLSVCLAQTYWVQAAQWLSDTNFKGSLLTPALEEKENIVQKPVKAKQPERPLEN